METEEEATMIVIDNSSYVPKDSHLFKTQLEAIRLYCHAKIKSNPTFRVGVATLGSGSALWPDAPTNDVEHFLTHTLEHIRWGGEYDILECLSSAGLGFATLPEGTKRRMLVFVAGPCHGYLTKYVLEIGERYKAADIALDVVSFAHQDQEFDALKTICLRSFVASAANSKDHKGHFARVPRHSSSSVLDILVSSRILSASEADEVALTEEGINKNMNKKKKKLKRNRTKKKKNHHSQDLEKHSQEEEEEEAVSSSCRAAVIIPEISLHAAEKCHLVFGSLEMHQLIQV